MLRKKKINFIAILLLVFAFVITSVILSLDYKNVLNTNAYTTGNIPPSIGSLTFTNYATREDGGVINGAVLDKLYGAITGNSTDSYSNALSTVQNSKSVMTGSANDASKNVNTQLYSMNFAQIEQANGGNAITLEFGGYTWNVVYLTTNTNANSSNGGAAGDLIATLWMSEKTSTSYQWNTYTDLNTSNPYPSNMYSTSKIRVDTLNAGGDAGTKYATSTTALNGTQTNRENHPYAAFTMSSATAVGQRSLTDFLATPLQVNYQIAENFIWSYCGTNTPHLCLNEAWGSGTDGVTGPDGNLSYLVSTPGGWYQGTAANTSDMRLTIQKTQYYDWKNDYLWLPSITEVGFKNDAQYGVSLWGIPSAHSITLSNNNNDWYRSGQYVFATNAIVLPTHNGFGRAEVNSSYAIRPAMHINLTKAEAVSKYELPVSDAISKVYNGDPQGIENDDWFTDSLKNSVTVEYYDKDTTGKLSDAPTTVGNYEVALTIKSGIDNLLWSDGKTGTQRRIEYTMTPKPIAFPYFYNNINSYPFNGGNPVDFQLADYDDTLISVTAPTGVIFNQNNLKVTATDVKKYELNVSLKDSKNYTWETPDSKLEFEITKAPIKLKLEDSDGGKLLSGIKGSMIKAYIEVDANYPPHAGKTVVAKIMANADSLRAVEIARIDITNSTRRQEINLNLADLIENVQYTLTVVTENAEYEIDKTDTTTLDVLDSSMRTKITWSLTADGSIIAGKFKDAEIADLSVAFAETITYDGKRYGFIVNPPNGYELDTNFGIGGYTVEYNNTSNSAVGTNVDVYKTRICLKRTSDNEKTEYEITWEIQKAKFDLSDVKWLYDGQLPYTPGGIKEILDSSTLPAGLIPSYSGSTFAGMAVGDGGEIFVTFSLSANYQENYELPVSSNQDSYIFTANGSLLDFEWSKNWEVVKNTIPIEWTTSTDTDKNGKLFTHPVIKGTQYANVLKYLYYETDSSGNILDIDNPIGLEDIEIIENERKFYKVQPVFANATHANNYVLQDNIFSTHFTLGEYSEAVELDLANKSLQYNARAQEVTVDILVGTIGVSSLDIVYYDRNGVMALPSAPMNVGEYRVEISIKAGVSGYYLTGTNVTNGTAIIEYEITKRIIDNSTWVTSHNPPSLQLSFYEIQGVTYEYADMNGTVIPFSALTPGNTYKVRALVIDPNNYEFSIDFNGDYFSTNWQEFTVSENEQLYDPLDPNNPFYPQDPDNAGTGDNNGGGSGSDVLNKIKEFFENLIKNNFPLWQVITSAVAILLTLIFMIKAIQYGNRKKKAKNEAKKYKARTMAAFLPIFSTEIVWLNLSNKIWSIIAFSLVGVTALMFIIALITRKSWKKAELAKENAMAEAGLNPQNSNQVMQGNQIIPTSADNGASLIADLRKELQETLTQVGQSGNTGDSSMLEQRLLEMEERRREDEMRHREEMEALREEQSKRDETMKMMLANLMGRTQAGDDMSAYASMEDTDLLVQKVIAGLLPAVQQMMPEATAYLNAPSEENEELKALVEEQKALVEEQRAIVDEQNEEIRNMSEQMNDLQAQLAELTAASQDRVEGVLLPDQSEDIVALTNQIAELQEQLLNASQDGENDHIDEINALTAEMNELRNQLANLSKGRVEVIDNSETIRNITAEHTAEIKAMTEDHTAELKALSEEHSAEMKALTAEVAAMREQLTLQSQGNTTTVYVERDAEEDNDDDEEEWDSVLDEDDDDFVEAVVIEADGTVKKTSPNFRMRLKQSSDTNRVWYTAIKNLFCSQKGITYRVYKRVEKIRYQGQVIAVIGIAKKSIKLWLALKPYEYDARRYHHKDVSDKPSFVDVPTYVRVSSGRALTRAEELILALFQELNMEARKRYTDRSIQELIFTLKHNRLLTNKDTKGLLCEVMHVHDCNVLDDETAEKCIESKNVDFIDESAIETVKLDDIDAKFQDGNRITLDKLKKVGLVSEKCTGYTVTANKRLTKPLIIVANDFTMTAVKLIALTGGRAIRLTQL